MPLGRHLSSALPVLYVVRQYSGQQNNHWFAVALVGSEVFHARTADAVNAMFLSSHSITSDWILIEGHLNPPRFWERQDLYLLPHPLLRPSTQNTHTPTAKHNREGVEEDGLGRPII
jgi:hypothetical protein